MKVTKKDREQLTLIAKKLPDTWVKRTRYFVKEIPKVTDIRGEEMKNSQFFEPGQNPVIVSDQEEDKQIWVKRGYELVSWEYHYDKLRSYYIKKGVRGINQYVQELRDKNNALNKMYPPKPDTIKPIEQTKEKESILHKLINKFKI